MLHEIILTFFFIFFYDKWDIITFDWLVSNSIHMSDFVNVKSKVFKIQ